MKRNLSYLCSVKMRRGSILPLWGLLLMMLSACTHDAYDVGDTDLSYLKAEMVMAHTSTSKSLVSAVTDEGESLTFEKPYECSWATTPDSIYRTLLYYNKVESRVGVITAQPVAVVRPIELKEKEPLHTDPVTVQSVWTSPRGDYLNLGLIVKTGVEEGLDAKQVIGCVIRDPLESLEPDASVPVTLYHHQNEVPEYYSSRVYVSIPLDLFAGHPSLTLTINTYSGLWVKTIQLPQ